ncbi:MAG: hypothetical protein KAT00_12835 [Planctomycetes bacterium]|nr:hypothetical protein [Planctomycetota bacterium]
MIEYETSILCRLDMEIRITEHEGGAVSLTAHDAGRGNRIVVMLSVEERSVIADILKRTVRDGVDIKHSCRGGV